MEQSVLNTEKVKQKVDELGVVTLVADWTDEDEKLGGLIETLSGLKQLPVIAFFPASNPQEPLVIATGAYTQNQIIQKLEKAGPSKDLEAKKEAVAKKYRLDWKPFSKEDIEKDVAEGKTVAVYFTADWDINSKVMEKAVWNTRPTKKKIEELGVETYLVDMTEVDENVHEFMVSVGGKRQTCITAIFSDKNTSDPFTFAGYRDTKELLKVLDQAGPSAGFNGNESATTLVTHDKN